MAIADAFADIVASSSEPALGAIRLAWWREALERLDTFPAPPEPRLQAVATELLSLGVSGKDIAAIEDGFAALLDEAPDADRVVASGAAMFACAAKLLGADDKRLPEAGGLYAVSRAVRLGFMAYPEQEGPGSLVGHRFALSLRPLTALARLAARDFKNGTEIETEATPGRAIALLSHRMFGTIA